MEFSATQIAAFLSGTIEGNPDVKVYNVAKIEEGTPGMLSFLANPKYSQYLYTTQSSIVLINNDFELQDKVSATLIRVPDAYDAFAQLLGLYQQFIAMLMYLYSQRMLHLLMAKHWLRAALWLRNRPLR